MKNTILLGLLSISLIGCNSFDKHIKCDNPEALTLVKDTLVNNLDDALVKELKILISNQSIQNLDPEKLKLSAKNVQFTLQDSRTDYIDPDSPKTTCSIDLAVVIPSDLIKKSDHAREAVNQASTENQADNLGLKYNQGKVNLVMEYVLQPSDKGDKVFAYLKNTAALNTFIADTLTYAFIKPQIEKNQIQAAENLRNQTYENNDVEVNAEEITDPIY